MRILHIHNFYSGLSGENLSVLRDVQVLKDAGVPTDLFAVHSTAAETEAVRSMLDKRGVIRDFKETLDRFQPDIVHYHNMWPFMGYGLPHALTRHSPSTRSILTLHNYRLSCISGTLFRDGAHCRDCVGKAVPLSGILHRCYRDSAVASTVAQAFHSAAHIKGSFGHFDGLLFLSAAQAEQFPDRLKADKRIYFRPNFTDTPSSQSGDRSGRFLYAGRLTQEKGVAWLVENWPADERYILDLAGEGPLEGFVRAAADARSNIRYLGSLRPDRTIRAMAEAQAVLVPSLWHEPFGRVAFEAMSVGTPIIATGQGAFPELVKKTGYGQILSRLEFDTLRSALQRARDASPDRQALCEAFQRHYGEAEVLRKTLEIYDDLLSVRRAN